jgi:hypothetical protein
MKIGLDIHGVIDLYPEYLSHLATVWISKGYEVHIVTGQELDHVQPILMDAELSIIKSKVLRCGWMRKRRGGWMVRYGKRRRGIMRVELGWTYISMTARGMDSISL